MGSQETANDKNRELIGRSGRWNRKLKAQPQPQRQKQKRLRTRDTQVGKLSIESRRILTSEAESFAQPQRWKRNDYGLATKRLMHRLAEHFGLQEFSCFGNRNDGRNKYYRHATSIRGRNALDFGQLAGLGAATVEANKDYNLR